MNWLYPGLWVLTGLGIYHMAGKFLINFRAINPRSERGGEIKRIWKGHWVAKI